MRLPCKTVRVRISKNCCYESPYYVIGINKHAGSKGSPKDICTDRNIGTWKGWNAELLWAKRRYKGNKANLVRTLRELYFIQLRVAAQYR